MKITADFSAHADLLNRAGMSHLDQDYQVLGQELVHLKHLITHELMVLVGQSRCSLEAMADLRHALHVEFERVSDWCVFPELAGKMVIGVGGRSDVGKATVLHHILGQVDDVDSQSFMSPTYLVYGHQPHIAAQSRFGHRITLTLDECNTLRADQQRNLESIRDLLKSILVIEPAFAWPHLALVDVEHGHDPHLKTPLWSDTIHALVWIVSTTDDGICAEDLEGLIRLDPRMPKIVILNHLDASVSDTHQKIQSIRQKLADDQIGILDVLPNLSDLCSQQALQAYFEQWNSVIQGQAIVLSIECQFDQAANLLAAKQHQAQSRLEMLDRVLAHVHAPDLHQEIEVLQQAAQAEIVHGQEMIAALMKLQQQCLTSLRRIGHQVGLSLTAPVDVLQMLRQLRHDVAQLAPELAIALREVLNTEPATRVPQLLRRHSDEYLDVLKRSVA